MYKKNQKVLGRLISIVGTTLVVQIDGCFIPVKDVPEEIANEYEPYVGTELPFSVKDIIHNEVILEVEPTDQAIIEVLLDAIEGVITGEMDMGDQVTLKAFNAALKDILEKPAPAKA